MSKSLAYGIAKIFAWLIPPFLLLLSSLSVYISPELFPVAELMCLAFPVWLAICIVVFIPLCFYRKKLVFIYLCIFLLNAPAIYNYCPINTNSEYRADLSVISYNVNGFGKKPHFDTELLKQFAEAFNNSDADIIFFQEGTWANTLADPLKTKYPYQEYTKTNGEYSVLGTFSKYPISSMEIIDTTSHNTCAVVKIILAEGDTLNVVNCHLVSLGISKGYNEGLSETNKKYHLKQAETQGLILQIMSAAATRAEQVDRIAAYLEKNKDANIILLGDFNDTPISYAHQKFSNYLSDCFRRSGNGIGRTYSDYCLPLRIDHLFCSKQWIPISCRIKNEIHLSDHFPLICTFKRGAQR